MLFMFGLIQRYLHNVLLVNHLRLRLPSWNQLWFGWFRMHVLKLMVLHTGCQRMVFRYAGKLESLPCLVEDHVYDNINLDSGNQMVSAGLNNLFGEVIWFIQQQDPLL